MKTVEKRSRKSNTSGRGIGSPERDEVHLPLMKLAWNYPKICPDGKCLLMHFANERKTTPWYGAILKAMGVTAGVSDLFLAYPTPRYPGYWIELKHGVNKPTALQHNFMKRMRQMGYAVDWFNDYRKAWNSILEYLGEPVQFVL